MKNNELYHTGVKEMKWGVRKNPVTAIKETRARSRKTRVKGEKANLKYMNDKERNKYSENRLKIMRTKKSAIISETINLLGKTAKSLALGAGGVFGSVGSGAAISAFSGAGVAATAGIMSASTGVGAAAVGSVLLTKAAIRGSRYIKNVCGIAGSPNKNE